jgi:uncharacterized protein (TIGR03086 family)
MTQAPEPTNPLDPTNPLAALDAAAAAYDLRLAAVREGQWGLPTPCDGWTVKDVADHVLGGNRFSIPLLAGGSAAEALGVARTGDFTGDPLAGYRESVVAQRQAVAAPGALQVRVTHPMGEVSGRRFVGMRTLDLTVHAWDLARATGGDERLPADLVDLLLALMLPVADWLPGSGAFGSGRSAGLAADADPQSRLLDLTGRRP